MDFSGSKSTKSGTNKTDKQYLETLSELEYFEVSLIDEKDYKVNVPLVHDKKHSTAKLEHSPGANYRELFETQEEKNYKINKPMVQKHKPLKAHRDYNSDKDKQSKIQDYHPTLQKQPVGDRNTIASGEFTLQNENIDFSLDNLETYIEDLQIEDQSLQKPQYKLGQHIQSFANQFINSNLKLKNNKNNEGSHNKIVQIKKKYLDIKQEEKQQQTTKKSSVSLEDFTFLKVIGRGTFGKVFLAKLNKTENLYAVKSIRKDVLLENDVSIESHILEKDIMMACNNPFLVNMNYLFQNDLRLYFVMPYIQGCELYRIVYTENRRLDDQTIIMYAAQIILAIGHLHAKGIVHRDLKLENILIDKDGYIKVIDYGLAKKLAKGQKSYDFMGTFLYMAPEMVTKMGHDKAVDWWAVGVTIYELMFGFVPFIGKTKNERFDKICRQKIQFPEQNHWTIEQHNLCNLISRLLEKDATKRLGSGKTDYLEILEHHVFQDLDIEKIKNKEYNPKFKPNFTVNLEDLGDQVTSDSFIPRENIKQVKANYEIFEQFNKENQLSMRGAWIQRSQRSQRGEDENINKNTDHYENILGINAQMLENNISKINNLNQEANQEQTTVSRNKPKSGFGYYSHKKTKSLKLTSQKPTLKEVLNQNYKAKYSRVKIEVEPASPIKKQITCKKQVQKDLFKN